MRAGNYELVVQQGATKIFEIIYKHIDDDGVETPIDLTSYFGRGQIRYRPSDPNPLAEFDVEILEPPTDGHIRITLPSTALEGITFKGRTHRDKTDAVYDIELHQVDGDGNDSYVIRLLEGKCSISPEVTK